MWCSRQWIRRLPRYPVGLPSCKLSRAGIVLDVRGRVPGRLQNGVRMRVSFARLWTGVVLCISVVVGSGVRTVAGQSIAVTGRVEDAVSGHAVTGAQLAIGSRTVLTDADGQFQFDVAAGRWDIEVTARDYLPRTIAIEARSEGVAPIEIQLIPRKGFQERLEVTAPAPQSGRTGVDSPRVRSRCSRPPAASTIRFGRSRPCPGLPAPTSSAASCRFAAARRTRT